MKDKQTFRTYLFLSNEKIIICAINLEDLKIIYEKQTITNNKASIPEPKEIKSFLDDNIYKIEKILNNFIKNIYVILDNENFVSIYLSIKNSTTNEFISTEDLSHSLNEAKNQCKKTLENKKIIHMLIEKYLIDETEYLSLPKNVKCKNFCLDLKFVCLPNNFAQDLEEFLKKYQISIQRILNATYIKDLSKKDENFFLKAHQIVEGCNANEIIISHKKPKIAGIFEKFFNFFS